MFTIKECTSEFIRCGECGNRCKFVPDLPRHNRIFAFDEDGVKAVGVLGLEGGSVVVCGVYGNVSEAERDLITRAVLNVCKGMNPITVRVKEQNDYFKQFGFIPDGNGMKISNKDIKF